MNVKIKFLGQGDFAKPIKDTLTKRFTLVEDNPDLQVVANYGKILTKEEIELPKYGTLNVHPSCLPKYRGATPLQNAILNGDIKTCVCIIKMVEKVDAGPILACEEIAIDPAETLESLMDKAGKMAAQIIPLTILQYVSGSINPKKQDESQKTYVKRLIRDDGLLDLSKPSEMLERQVRAYRPWPGSFIMLGDKRLIIHKATIQDNYFVPVLVQLEGKNPVSWQEFKHGWRGALGGVFGSD